MEREDIERSDFPVGRRGYDQDAVDAHLRAVSDEIERLRSAAPAPRVPSLAAGTSEQVRVILEAAERSAAELREDAGRQAGEHVVRVQEAADGMLRRLDELQNELAALLGGLRASGERLVEGLAALQASVGDAQGTPEAGAEAPVASPEPEPEPEPPVEPAPPKDEDEAGARIIALNMALGGSSREETAAYLGEHFSLSDPEALLDDVYAKVGR